MIPDSVRTQIRSWIDSTYAEQPILAISHNQEQLEELCAFAIAHALPGKQSAVGNHPDAIMIRAEDGKKTISVKDIKAFKATISSRPTSGKRIVCIPQAEQLLPESANMLLKTLEESAVSTRFLLGSPAKRSVLTTIKSRCIVLALSDEEEVKAEPIDILQLLTTYSAIRPTGPYTDEELRDIERILHAYAMQYGSNMQLAKMATRLKEYYKTASIPGGNIKLASDILLASLTELRNTVQ
ncbi:MAG: hypothetical protein K8Q97_04615 [Candidatus Andersenbacteria bacterium]|nr:hypothetical protein [Candidatus Andersenbacteria bacterium]